MAGRPQRRAIAAELARRALEYFEGDTERTPLDYACAWVSDGGTLLKLAADLSDTLAFEVRRERLSAYLYETYDDAEPRLTSARARSSHTHAEEALEVIEGQAFTSAEVADKRERARVRLWLAERFSPDLQLKREGGVTINVASLHLAALQAVQALPQPGPVTPLMLRSDASATPQVVDAEVVSVEPCT